ncbi:tyrosine-type recombinase/integrase [Microbacterium rhizosphaerae]|uniref:Site-specific integrase n=1 Tax=Microbacterium rhizosphaerae TaxID=1678237 RepID=A0ABZ0SUG8_9MICO|nr:site-specific integrase [Microbacterium rhizosphaerae]WPR91292.1 site-specific integrase [Microbacterium rhizosphaerae]
MVLTARYRRQDGIESKTTAQGLNAAEAKRKLMAKLPELVAQAEAGKSTRSRDNSLTFRDVALEWIRYDELRMEQLEIKRSTFNEHQRIARNILIPRLGDNTLDEFTTREIAVTYHQMVREWPAQARNAKGVLSLIMTFAAQMGLVDRNLVREVPAIRRKKKEIFAPGIDELRVFRDAVVAYNEDPNRPGPMPGPLLLDSIDMILATGMRIGEVLGLRWEKDVFLDDRSPYVVVNGAIKEKGGAKRWEPFPKTEAGRRAIAIPDYASAILLRRMVENVGGSEFVFHTRTRRPNGPQDVHRSLRNVRRHANLADDYVPHALRKSVGTTVADTIGLEQTALLLGHERSRVTEQFYAKRTHETPDVRHILQAVHESILASE